MIPQFWILAQDPFFTEELIVQMTSKALFLILMLSAPMLLSALGVGLIVSLIQATTQIQEQTLSFVPKIIATFLALVLSGTWILGTVKGFTVEIFQTIAKLGVH